jgi:hypothetical protein
MLASTTKVAIEQPSIVIDCNNGDLFAELPSLAIVEHVRQLEVKPFLMGFALKSIKQAWIGFEVPVPLKYHLCWVLVKMHYLVDHEAS